MVDPKKSTPRRSPWPYVLGALIVVGVVAYSLSRDAGEEKNEQPTVVANAHPENQVEAPGEIPPAPTAEASSETPLEAESEAIAPPKHASVETVQTPRRIVTKRAKPAAKAEASASPPPAEEPETQVAVEEAPPPPAEEPLPKELATPMPKAGLEVVFKPDASGVKTKSLELEIDDQPMVRKTLLDADSAGSIALYTGTLPAGKHRVTLRAQMIGDAKIFRYLDDYAFTIKHEGVLMVEPGENTRLEIRTVKEGDVTSEWTNRIRLKVDVKRTRVAPGSEAS
jgi:hypothetical protein